MRCGVPHRPRFDWGAISVTIRKRFIAGAVCPSCGAQDRLVVEETPDHKRRRCVNCGFTDTNASEPEVALPTPANLRP